jgi:hypothetical protein
MDERREQTRHRRVEALFLEDGSGGDHPDDLTFEQLPPAHRVALLADRDRVPGREQPGDVRLRWESAQRHPSARRGCAPSG